MKPEDMVVVEKDVYSGFSAYLARQIVAAYDRKKPAGAALRDAVALLRPWNGQMEKGTAAPMLITLAYFRIQDTRRGSGVPRQAGKSTVSRWRLRYCSSSSRAAAGDGLRGSGCRPGWLV